MLKSSDPIKGGGMRIAFAILLSALLLVVVVFPVLADNGGVTIPTFDEALRYASGIGVSIIAGFLISVLLDYWPAYADLTTAQKRAVYAGFCLVVPVGAATLRGALSYAPWTFDPLFWHAIWSGVAAALTGTLAHIKIRTNRK